VGEVKAARPLVRELRQRHPDVPLVLSTTTPAGFETALREFPDLYVFHAPVDFAPVVRSVVRQLAPRLVVLVELEVWPALMRAVDESGAGLAIVNGRITESSFRGYRRWSWFLPEFDRLDLVAAQDETFAGRFEALGVERERLHVTGNLKHELTAPTPAATVAALGAALGLRDGRPVFVAGSTHEGEDAAALEAWRAAGGPASCRLVLAPRHMKRVADVERLVQRAGLGVTRRSAGPAADGDAVLLLDTLGELEAVFGLASVVFLGGSLVEVGGHNVLEPAAAGRPVLVGPHLESCRVEAELLQRAGGLRVVADARELGQALGALLRDGAAREAMGRAARKAAEGLRGAAQADVALLRRQGLLASLEGRRS
jgi:3-deoxy-D-manno-octulosonic-acid transferase